MTRHETLADSLLELDYPDAGHPDYRDAQLAYAHDAYVFGDELDAFDGCLPRICVNYLPANLPDVPPMGCEVSA